MEDNRVPIEPYHDHSQDSAAPNIRLTNARMKLYQSPEAYESDLARLLASFQGLQRELAAHTRPESGDASEVAGAQTADSDSDSLSQIRRLKDDLAELLDLNESNADLRAAIDNATDDQGEESTDSDDVSLKLYDPDKELNEESNNDSGKENDDSNEDSAQPVAAQPLQEQESKLNQQLDVLQNEVTHGEDELARAQATLEALLNRSTRNPTQPTLAPSTLDPTSQSMALASDLAQPLPVQTDPNATGKFTQSAQQSTLDSDQPEPETLSIEPSTADEIAQKDELIEALQDTESELQNQINEASSQTETLRTELDHVRQQAEEQQAQHQLELAQTQSEAQQAIAAAVTTERLSAADSLAKHLADEVTQLRGTQQQQSERLESQSHTLQERLQDALTNEAALRAKLEAAQELAQRNESQANQLSTQHTGELQKLTEQLTQAESSRQTLDAEKQRLQQVASELQANHDEATEAAQAIQQHAEAQQQRLTAIESELQAQCEHAATENEQLQAQLAELTTQKHLQDETIQKQAAQLQHDTESAAATQRQIKQEHDQATASAVNLANELDELQAGHSLLREKCAGQVDQIQTLLAEKQSLDDQQRSKSTSLNAQTAELLRLTATHQNLVKQSEAQAAQITALLAENENHATQQSQSAEEIQQAEAKSAAMKVVQRQLTTQLADLSSQLQVLLQRYETAQTENASQQSTLQEQQLTLQTQQTNLRQQQSEIEQLQRLYDGMHEQSLSQTAQLQQLQDEKERLSQQADSMQESLTQKRTELEELLAQHDAATQSAQQQTDQLKLLQAENEQLLSDDSATNQALNDTLNDRLEEIERLRNAHESIRGQSVEQADKIMRLINENQRLSRADRMRAQEVAERKAELVHLRDALDDLKINGDLQASRIDHLINEKRQLIQEKTESESISMANLQAAASDFEKLKAEKQAVDERLLELHGAKNQAPAKPPSESASDKVINRAQRTPQRAKELSDDLTRIEGIGPKIQTLLAEKKIRTYRKLASTSLDRLQKILLDAGGNFHMHDPTTWPDQAQLAADGNWKKLVRLQDSLVGGRRA